MKTYLVGGAVRDRLLGLTPKERDWVVVGASPKDLLQAGYTQVGKDFPVFLHPETKEEYALARTERKSGKGYHGFEVHADPAVTLEEDLLRRDLTINAMAEDEQGNLIDPYGGKTDLQAKILRHVSPAFAEDPLRVLRVARFAARFQHLGFQLADETRQLLCAMSRSGELNTLVPERIWQEWQRSLSEQNPEQFILLLRQCGALEVIIPELDKLFGVPNPPEYHPEIDSGIHTIMTLQAASQLSDDPCVRFAALVHDLGKAQTAMNEWPKHQGHEQSGLPVIRELCSRLRIPTVYRELALLACEHHLNIHRFANLRPETRVKLLEKADAFRRRERFHDLLLVCQADAQGVGGTKRAYPQLDGWEYLLAECDKIQARELLSQGFEGIQLKQELHQRRVACAKLIESMRIKNEK